MKLAYTLTFGDYKAAQMLHMRQKLTRRINYHFWFSAVPVLAVVGLIIFVAFDLRRITTLAPVLFGIEGGLIWIAVFFPLARAYNLRKCFKQLLPSTHRDKPILLEISDEGVVSSIPGVSEGRFFWDAILRFAKNEKVHLFYVTEKRFLFVPTCAFQTEQLSELTDLIARKLAGRQC